MSEIQIARCKHGCTDECLACYDETIERLRQQLAESQAREHVQLTTLARFVNHGTPFEDDAKWAEIADVAIKLLNWKYDSTALDAMLAQHLAKAKREENEACAKVCDEQFEKDRPLQVAGGHSEDYRIGYLDGSGDCGHAIRSRMADEVGSNPTTLKDGEQ